MPVIELRFEDRVPAILDCARRTGEREQIGALGHPGTGARLDRRSADLVKADAVKDGGEALDLLLEDAAEGFGRDVAAGKPCAAGGNDDIDFGIGDPLHELIGDARYLVWHDHALRDEVAGIVNAGFQYVAGAIVLAGARIRHRHQGDAYGNEFARTLGHGLPLTYDCLT